MTLPGVLMFCCLLGAQPKPRPAAMVLETGAEAKVHRGDAAQQALKVNPGPQPLRDLDLLYLGDRVEAGKDGVLLVFLKGGLRERVLAGMKANVTASGCQPGAAVQRLAARLPAAAVDALPELRGSERAGVASLRGPGPAVSPLEESIVSSDRPPLTWPSVPGTLHYEVRL
jgi:hypothetical protein